MTVDVTEELKRTRDKLRAKRKECRDLQTALRRHNSTKVRELQRHNEQLVDSVADAVAQQATAQRETRSLKKKIDEARRLIVDEVGWEEDDLVELVSKLVAFHVEDREKISILEDDVRREKMENFALRREWGQA